ncbi:MAG: EutP/PduV family microcompartment system protein [Hespellia sp.]|nr:EutP/PduV family microcompartment system protein [Hespellia sp.]
MKKMIMIGRSECGKTTLMQALRGGTISYHKTQYVNHFNVIIDTPGEYAENYTLARALALYSYEADVIALLLNCTEPYSLYSPCVAAVANRPVIGIVTQIDRDDGENVKRATNWLKLAGCDPIFQVSSYNGDGIWKIFEYLSEPGDELPWKNQAEAEKPRNVVSTKHGDTGTEREIVTEEKNVETGEKFDALRSARRAEQTK